MKSIKSMNPSRRGFQRTLQLVFFMISFSCFGVANSWKWIAYGDTRSNDNYHRLVLQSIMNNTSDYKFMINVGDVVSHGDQQSEWIIWQNACDDILGGTGQDSIPPKYMSAPGNHDATETSAGLANWNSYLSGQVQQYGNEGKYFIFDYENARFIIMDSDKSDEDGPQLTMLLDAIQNNPKTWLFAIWHHPIFDFGEKQYEDVFHDLWGVPLYQNGCDIMFMGHAHYYVRNKKLALDGEMHPPLDPENGTVQVVTGNGGASMDVPIHDHGGNEYMVAAYTTSDLQHGYTELTVNDSTLHLRHILRNGMVWDEADYTPNQKPVLIVIEEDPPKSIIPEGYKFYPNYPNPFNANTTFEFELGLPGLVEINVYDITGYQVTNLLKTYFGTGLHSFIWNANNLPSGLYFYKAEVNNFTKVGRFLLLK